jgi:hypothetical protein
MENGRTRNKKFTGEIVTWSDIKLRFFKQLLDYVSGA